MTDKKIVENILKHCTGKFKQTLNYFIHRGYVKFNDNEQCIHLELFAERLTEIPDELLELKHLEFLDLNFNKLTYIPKELNYIKELYTDGNPLLNSKDRVEILFNKNFKNN